MSRDSLRSLDVNQSYISIVMSFTRAPRKESMDTCECEQTWAWALVMGFPLLHRSGGIDRSDQEAARQNGLWPPEICLRESPKSAPSPTISITGSTDQAISDKDNFRMPTIIPLFTNNPACPKLSSPLK
ncbi:unnamed protein product [Victoria cruziana]